MKKSLYILFTLITFFTFSIAYAEEIGACSVTELAKLRQTAANVKVSYVPGYVNPISEDGKSEYSRYIDVKVFNITSDMILNIDIKGNGIKTHTSTYKYSDKGEDGSITLRQKDLNETITYYITVVSNKDNCTGDTLRTFKLSIPKFNQYSELRACEDIPEYYLCQEYVTFNIDGTTFYQSVDKYKEKLANQSDDTNITDDDFANETLKKISDYKYIIVGAIVVIGVLATIMIIKGKKSESR